VPWSQRDSYSHINFGITGGHTFYKVAFRMYSEFANLTSFVTSIGYAYLSLSISLNKLIDIRRRDRPARPGPEAQAQGRAGRSRRLVSIRLLKLIDKLI